MKQCVLLLLTTLLLLNGPAAAAGKGADDGVEKLKLKNGLTVLLKQVDTAPVVTVYVGYKVGSKNEPIGKSGMSHLLEHMMFRGTDKYPKDALTAELSAMGASFNAYTHYDITCYFETVPSRYLEKALILESDRMVNAKLTQESLDQERPVVITELEGGLNSPVSVLYQEVAATMFRNHPYRWPIIGYKTDVESITGEDLMNYYKTYYTPSNAVLVVAGDFRRDEALRLIEKYFGPLPAAKAPEKLSVKEDPQTVEKAISVKNSGKTPIVLKTWHAPSFHEKDYYSLNVLSEVLGGGKSSRLYKALVSSGVAAEVSSFIWEMDDPGMFAIMALPTDPQHFRQVEEIIAKTVAEIETSPITARELETAVNAVKAGVYKNNDSVSSQADRLGFFEVMGNYKDVYTYIEKTQQVTAKDVSESAKKYLVPEKSTTGRSIPQATSDTAAVLEIPATKFGYRDVAQAGNSGAAVSGKFTFTRTGLSNGVTVLIKEIPTSDMLYMGGYIDGSGSASDAPDKNGLSSYTSEMLERGTRNLSFEEISELLDRKAFTLGFDARRTRTKISGSAMAELTDEFLELAGQIVREPVFPEKELDLYKKSVRTLLEYNGNDPSYRAGNAFFETLYPAGSSIGKPVMGTLESMDSITAEDLRRFHATYYRPENTVLVFAGKLNEEKLKAKLEETFGKWKAAAPAAAVAEEKLGGVTPQTREIYIKDKAQAVIVSGHLAPEPSGPDFYAFSLFNRVLGGGILNSRLIKDIRVNKGLVYSIGSYTTMSPENNAWIIQGGTSPDNVDKALAAIDEILKTSAEKGITEKELQDAKSALTNETIVKLNSPRQQLLMLEDMEYLRLGDDYVDRLADRYNSLTLEQVNEAGRKYIHPGRRITVVAGSYGQSRETK